MKKQSVMKAVLFSLLAVTAACTSDEVIPGGVELPDDNQDVVEPEEKDDIEVDENTVLMNVPPFKYVGNPTRGTYSPSGQSYTFAWSAGDVVGVTPVVNAGPTTGYQTAFTLVDGAGSNLAAFKGGDWALKPNTTYYAFYPLEKNMHNEVTAFPVDFSHQHQYGNGSTAHLSQCGYMWSMTTTPDSLTKDGQQFADFQHLASLVHLACNLPQGFTADSIELSSETPVFIETSTVDLTALVPAIRTDVSKVKKLLYPANVTVNGAGVADFYLMMAPSDLSASVKVALVAGNGARMEGTFTGGNLVAGNAYTYSVDVKPLKVEVDYTPNVTGTQNLHKNRFGAWAQIRYVSKVELFGNTFPKQSVLTLDANGNESKEYYADFTAKSFKVKKGQKFIRGKVYCLTEARNINTYIYIDSDGDGFTGGVVPNNYNPGTYNPDPNTDLVAYSCYEGYNNEGDMVNESRKIVNTGMFNIPADLKPGKYRMRWKLDTNNIDPAGGPNLWDDHGAIIDVTLEITE